MTLDPLVVVSDLERTQAGEKILKAMVEFQALFCRPTQRMCDGVLEPWIPTIVYEIAFMKPLATPTINPAEIYGSLQQVLHSKDGNYVSMSIAGGGAAPRVWLSSPSTTDRQAVALLMAIQRTAIKTDAWVAVASPGRTIAKLTVSSLAPGVLIPNPGEVITTTLASFQEHFTAFTEEEAKKQREAHTGLFGSLDSLPDGVLQAAANGATVDITDTSDDTACRRCGDEMTFEMPAKAPVTKSATTEVDDADESIAEEADTTEEMWHCRKCDLWAPTSEQMNRWDANAYERRVEHDATWERFLKMVEERHPIKRA